MSTVFSYFEFFQHFIQQIHQNTAKRIVQKTQRALILFLFIFLSAKFYDYKDKRKSEGNQIGNRCRIKNTVKAKEFGKDKQQRNNNDYLTQQGKNYALDRLAYCREVI